MKKKMKAKERILTSYYSSKETARQLAFLIEHWGESASATIRRAISLAYDSVTSKKEDKD